MKKSLKRTEATFDWSRADAMTDEQVHAAALSDPDAQPWTEEQLRNVKESSGLPRIRILMRLSQEAFAEKFRIPLGTLRDWEQHRKEPNAVARAYLKVIARDPEAVVKALGGKISSPASARSAA